LPEVTKTGSDENEILSVRARKDMNPQITSSSGTGPDIPPESELNPYQ